MRDQTLPSTLSLSTDARPAGASLNPLILWHLLSLDAPTIAALWLWFAARETRTHLAPALIPAMFFAVWMLYIVDRLLDASAHTVQTNQGPLALRHEFHQRHRTAFLAALAASACTLSLLLVHLHLPHAYFALAGLLLVWLAAVHATGFSARLPKEIVTGAIFAAAIWTPELPHHSLLAFLFAALCTLNCVAIHTWEGPQKTHPLTRVLSNHLPALLGLLALSALARAPVALAIGAAAAALLGLHLFRRSLPAPLLRALADAALLTPLLFLHIAIP